MSDFSRTDIKGASFSQDGGLAANFLEDSVAEALSTENGGSFNFSMDIFSEGAVSAIVFSSEDGGAIGA